MKFGSFKLTKEPFDGGSCLSSHHGRWTTFDPCRDLRKTYHVGDQMVQALDGLIDIHANEYVALMGPSGSGKSTLMNMLGCLDSPTSGQYILNGQDVSRLDDAALADIRAARSDSCSKPSTSSRATPPWRTSPPTSTAGFRRRSGTQSPRSAHPSRAWRPDGPQAQ